MVTVPTAATTDYDLFCKRSIVETMFATKNKFNTVNRELFVTARIQTPDSCCVSFFDIYIYIYNRNPDTHDFSVAALLPHKYMYTYSISCAPHRFTL